MSTVESEAHSNEIAFKVPVTDEDVDTLLGRNEVIDGRIVCNHPQLGKFTLDLYRTPESAEQVPFREEDDEPGYNAFFLGHDGPSPVALLNRGEPFVMTVQTDRPIQHDDDLIVGEPISYNQPEKESGLVGPGQLSLAAIVRDESGFPLYSESTSQGIVETGNNFFRHPCGNDQVRISHLVNLEPMSTLSADGHNQFWKKNGKLTASALAQELTIIIMLKEEVLPEIRATVSIAEAQREARTAAHGLRGECPLTDALEVHAVNPFEDTIANAAPVAAFKIRILEKELLREFYPDAKWYHPNEIRKWVMRKLEKLFMGGS